VCTHTWRGLEGLSKTCYGCCLATQQSSPWVPGSRTLGAHLHVSQKLYGWASLSLT
jgi:hypothetical protein